MCKDFSTQRMQAFTHASDTRNGMMIGQLLGIESFDVYGWCEPVFDENDGSEFGNAMKDVLKHKTLSQEKIDTIKTASVHSEILQILKEKSSEEYEAVHSRVHLGLSTTKFSLNLKKDFVQYQASVLSLCEAINAFDLALTHIAKNKAKNKTNLLDHGIKTKLAMSYSIMNEGFGAAMGLMYQNASEVKSDLDKAKDSLCKVHKFLGSKSIGCKQPIVGQMYKSDIKRFRQEANDTYRAHQQELMKLKSELPSPSLIYMCDEDVSVIIRKLKQAEKLKPLKGSAPFNAFLGYLKFLDKTDKLTSKNIRRAQSVYTATNKKTGKEEPALNQQYQQMLNTTLPSKIRIAEKAFDMGTVVKLEATYELLKNVGHLLSLKPTNLVGIDKPKK